MAVKRVIFTRFASPVENIICITNQNSAGSFCKKEENLIFLLPY
jgi:hypothetical protein